MTGEGRAALGDGPRRRAAGDVERDDRVVRLQHLPEGLAAVRRELDGALAARAHAVLRAGHDEAPVRVPERDRAVGPCGLRGALRGRGAPGREHGEAEGETDPEPHAFSLQAVRFIVHPGPTGLAL